jgi:hypothetical protein
MSAVIPKNLNEIYRNLTGYKRNLVRFYADRTGSINANDVLRWTFPKEKVALDSLTHFFEFSSTNAGTGTGSARTGTFFPRNSASIIDTITVFINGAVYENITSYNHLFNLIYDNSCGFNYYNSGIRALECADPSIRYTVADASGNAITATVQGTNNTATTDATACDTKRPLQIRNWIGFLGTANRIVDLTNTELIVEIRYAPGSIVFKGADAAANVAATPTYTIDNYYMTIQKIDFEDDSYQMALNSLKNSGNYSLTFKTYSSSRSGSVAKSTNPSIQFSATAKYLSKLYFTFVDGTFDTISRIQNTGNGSSFSESLANLRTNVDAFNQSKYFQKNGVSLTELQCEINGIPVYPYPQNLAQIKNNNLDALEIEKDNNSGDFPGLQSLESWAKFSFVMISSFEHYGAWKEGIVSGYPNTNGNLLNIKYNSTFSGSAAGNVYLLAFAERIVKANFNGASVSIEY